MAYSGEDLFRNYRKTYVISPFQASQVSPLGYDLRVGHALTVRYPSPDKPATLSAEMKAPNGARKALIERPARELVVGPNESVPVITVEQIYLSSKVLGTVQAKASVSIRGLMINPVTVDPNFGSQDNASGRLLLFMHNLSGRNLVLKEKQGIATLIIHEVATETLHLPEKTGFEDVLSAAGETYDSTVLDQVKAYTDLFKSSRGTSEFARDRKAVVHYRSTHRTEA